MDLFTASPRDIRALMDRTEDVEVLRALADLEAAALAEDEEARVAAVDRLLWRVVVEGGVWG